jgi:hypothetical protein
MRNHKERRREREKERKSGEDEVTPLFLSFSLSLFLSF